jgi:hypothetical protein
MQLSSPLQAAKRSIVAHFARLPVVLQTQEIAQVLAIGRVGWHLPAAVTLPVFIDFLLDSGWLQCHRFKFPQRPQTLYTWGEASHHAMALKLKPRSYLSHFTALRAHGLAIRGASRLYQVTHERTSLPDRAPLTQAAIDDAFSQPARVSSQKAVCGTGRVTLFNGANTGEAGVVDMLLHDHAGRASSGRITSLERTLIDAAVRPVYCGGVKTVAQCYAKAKSRLDLPTLLDVLARLHLSYPHHQAIGYYLERTGWDWTSLAGLHRQPMDFDFFLMHEMARTEYVARWRLHVPQGF